MPESSTRGASAKAIEMSDDATTPIGQADPQDGTIPLIGGTFEAAMNATNWRDFVGKLAEVLAKHGILLLVQKVGPEVFRTHAPEKFEPMHDKPQDRIRIRLDLVRDLKADSLQMTSKGGAVEAWKPVKGATAEEVAASQAPTYVLGCFVSRQDSNATLMGVRWRDEPMSNEQALAFLRGFVPQLQLAFTLHKQFTQLRVQHHAASDVLNWLPFGVLFVGIHGEVLTKNRRASDIAEERDGLVIERSMLSAASTRETTRLRELILHAAASTKQEIVSKAMTVARPSMRRPLTVMVNSLSSPDKSQVGVAPAAVVFVSDPEENYNIAEETVLHFFNLTPAEARLLVELTNGTSLSEIAERYDVTINTLKTQLNHIFRKTGTNRQPDLIKLVFSTPVVMNALASEKQLREPSQDAGV